MPVDCAEGFDGGGDVVFVVVPGGLNQASNGSRGSGVCRIMTMMKVTQSWVRRALTARAAEGGWSSTSRGFQAI